MASFTWLQAFGLVSAMLFRDGFHVQPERFQGVQQEGIADRLHVVIKDLEDGFFGLSDQRRVLEARRRWTRIRRLISP